MAKGIARSSVSVRLELLSRILAIFVISVAVNYIWELAQTPFYGTMEGGIWWHCFVASVGDGFIVLLIFAIGASVRRNRNWFERPALADYLLALFIGGIIAAVVEWVALYYLQRWSYRSAMPIVPGVNIGVLPFLQMLVLPPLIFRVAAMWGRTRLSKAVGRLWEL